MLAPVHLAAQALHTPACCMPLAPAACQLHEAWPCIQSAPSPQQRLFWPTHILSSLPPHPTRHPSPHPTRPHPPPPPCPRSLALPPGSAYFKYLVDGEWICSPTEQVVANGKGFNNHRCGAVVRASRAREGACCARCGHAGSLAPRCGWGGLARRAAPPASLLPAVLPCQSRHCRGG